VFDGGLEVQGGGYLYFNMTPTVSGGASVRLGVLSIPSPIAGGVRVDGGGIEMRGDWDIASVVAPGSTGGDLLWRGQNAITFGGTNQLNFTALGAAGPLRLGASTDSTITAWAIITPDNTSRTVHFGAGDAKLTVNSVLADTPAGPTGLDFSGHATTVLNASNTFTGITAISGGVVEANTLTAFGTTAGPTVVTGGEVHVNTYTDEPFIVHDGYLRTEQGTASTFDITGGVVSLYDPGTDPIFTNPVTISGGVINYNVFSYNTGTVTGAIDLHGGGESVIRGQIANNEIVLAGPIRGDGTVVLETYYAKLVVETAMTHTGDTVIYSDMWLNPSFDRGVYFKSTQAFGGDLIMDGGILFNDAPNTVPNLIMKDGRIAGTAPLTIVHPVLNMRAGEIEIPGGLIGITHIAKTGMDEGKLLDLGTLISPTVEVEAGRLVLGKKAGDVISGAVQLRAGALADIVIAGAPDLMADIDLNNGTGVSYSGALSNDHVGYIGGTVNLGDGGAYIGGTEIDGVYGNHHLTINGRITGGGLTKVGGSTLVISGSANDYTGTTTIAEGILNITTGGRLTTTESINVMGNGVLRIDNGTAPTNQDLLGDNVPIRTNNGIIEFISPVDRPSFEETLGALNLESGAAVIISDQTPYGLATPQSIEFTALDRQRSATISFQTDHARMGVPGGHSFRFTEAPSLTNGIIGGWAVAVNPQFNEVDFVTYDPLLGVTALPEAGRPGDINTADATSNVLLTGAATATADRSVNSLDMGRHNVNLDGHTLTIESGGLLMGEPAYAPEMSYGRLTSGADMSELIIHVGTTNHSRGGVIRADIVDSAGGPTDLVVSRFWTTSSTYVDLYGNNTYTGKTYLNKGAGVYIQTPGAAPTGNDVVINGGVYNVLIPSGQVVLGDITIRDGGDLVSQRFNGIRADVIHAESGSIRADLFGDTPLVKTTTGLLTIGYANGESQDRTNTNYTGDIDIQNGILVVEPKHGLGGGAVTVREGGRLVLNRPYSAADSIMHGQIVMAGGELAVGIRDDAVLEGRFDVIADSTVLTFYGLAGRYYYHSFGSVNDQFATRHVTLAGDTTLAEGTTLGTLGAGTLAITGDLLMHSGSKVAANVIVQPGAGRRVSGAGTVGGGVLIGDGAGLMPGTGVGRLTIEGDYSQLPGGLLTIELSGGSGVPGTDYDHLLVTGAARFAGALSVLLADGFVPAPQDVFTIIDAGSIVGGFDLMSLPDIGNDLAWLVSQTDTSLTLRVVSTLAGDLNGDGFVGIADLNIVLPTWNTHVTPGDQAQGDTNGDGFVGIEDLNAILGNWNSGTPPQAASVPEPTGAVMGTLIVLNGLRQRPARYMRLRTK
jgi:autotransporter-associated beta strand protein